MKIEDNVIIARISPGLANQMYEFATAYALSRELNRELILDISSCYHSAFGYLVDYFKIPLCKKLICNKTNGPLNGHLNDKSLPLTLRSRVSVWKEDDSGDQKYRDINNLETMEIPSAIYLCGYFFTRNRYYDKYWEEIKDIFTLRDNFREINKFKDLINGKTSIGIHIRRGDMLLADWAISMKDDYYRAAVMYCKKRYDNCIFCVFSDDIGYAKQILGQDSSMYYVHFRGYDDAALVEFICLSLCNHRVLSNSSTFSRLADQLNGNAEGHFFVQATAKGKTEFNNHVKRFIENKLLNKPEGRRIIVDRFDLRKYGKRYASDGKCNIENYQERENNILLSNVTEDNAQFILDEICELSLNVYEGNDEKTEEILLKKFMALVKCEEYHMALQVSFIIYEKYKDDEIFKKSLILALRGIGADREAVLESVTLNDNVFLNSVKGEDHGLYDGLRLSPKQFVIVPGIPMSPSSYIQEMIELGIALHHMGHAVSVVFSPGDEGEGFYIKNNPFIINRNGANLGIEQFDIDQITGMGIKEFYQSFGDKELVVISRKIEFYIEGMEKIKYVFPDFSDLRDTEAVPSKDMPLEEIQRLYHEADIVLTKDKKLASLDSAILWEDCGCQDEYWICSQRWELGYEHRISDRTIDLARALVSGLKDKSA